MKSIINVPGIKLASVVREKAINEKDAEIPFRLTSRTTDRDSEVILPIGAILTNFEKNPRYLWSHNKEIPSIGRVQIEDRDHTEEYLDAPVRFDVKNDAFAEMIFMKYLEGFLDAGSIGFIPFELGKPILRGQKGVTVRIWELLEFSSVNVPSNPESLQREYRAAVDRTYKDFAKPYYDGIKAFYESTPEGKAHIEKVHSYMSTIYTKHAEWPLGKAAKTNAKEKTQKEVKNMGKQKSMIGSFIQNPVGSHEWVNDMLRNGVRGYLLEHSEITEYRPYSDYAVIVATFGEKLVDGAMEFTAIIALIGDDRTFYDDYFVRATWEMSEEGIPVFTGEPVVVDIAYEWRERLAAHSQIKKPLMAAAEKRHTPKPEEAEARLKAWAEERNLTDELSNIAYDNFGNILCDVVEGEVKAVLFFVANAMLKLLSGEYAKDHMPDELEDNYKFLCRFYTVLEKTPPEFKTKDAAGEAPEAEPETDPEPTPEAATDEPEATEPESEDDPENSPDRSAYQRLVAMLANPEPKTEPELTPEEIAAAEQLSVAMVEVEPATEPIDLTDDEEEIVNALIAEMESE